MALHGRARGMGKTGCVHDDAYGRPPVDAQVVEGALELVGGELCWLHAVLPSLELAP